MEQVILRQAMGINRWGNDWIPTDQIPTDQIPTDRTQAMYKNDSLLTNNDN